MAICQLTSASRHYGDGETLVKAADEVSLVIEPGEFTVLSGPSGSGKTTVLNLVGLLDRPTSGTVSIQDHPTATMGDRALTRLRGESIGFIFQSFPCRRNQMQSEQIQSAPDQRIGHALQMPDRLLIAE